MKSMKSVFAIFAVVMMTVFAGQAFPCSGIECLNLGYTFNHSVIDKTVSNPGWSAVDIQTNSFFGGGVLGSGYANGSTYAQGEALTTHNATLLPGVVAQDTWGTQNLGSALGGFDYSIKTGSKNFCFIFPPVVGAIAGTKGDVSQYSIDDSKILGTIAGNGANSIASQQSAAGFIGADADLMFGKVNGRPPLTSSFRGEAYVTGYTYSSSYKGGNPVTEGFLGTQSAAGNTANFSAPGGSGYAGGSGQTSGQSLLNLSNGTGSTSGLYSGQFSYKGNGSGDVSGFSVSNFVKLDHGAAVSTFSGVSVNVGPMLIR